MVDGRYRVRAWLPKRLPGVVATLVPKGRHDCGAHEWYRADEQTWRCYYCASAVVHSSPWTREEQLQRTLSGIASTLRMVAMRGEPGGERELAGLAQALQAG